MLAICLMPFFHFPLKTTLTTLGVLFFPSVFIAGWCRKSQVGVESSQLRSSPSRWLESPCLAVAANICSVHFWWTTGGSQMAWSSKHCMVCMLAGPEAYRANWLNKIEKKSTFGSKTPRQSSVLERCRTQSFSKVLTDHIKTEGE